MLLSFNEYLVLLGIVVLIAFCIRQAWLIYRLHISLKALIPDIGKEAALYEDTYIKPAIAILKKELKSQMTDSNKNEPGNQNKAGISQEDTNKGNDSIKLKNRIKQVSHV